MTGLFDALRDLLHYEPVVFRSRMKRPEFHRFMLAHPDLKIERDKRGVVTIHPPMGFDSGFYEGEIFGRLYLWSKTNDLGAAYSPSTAFAMPDGAEYRPDGAWLTRENIARLSAKERRHIAHIVPDFVLEVRSETDRIGKLKKKMAEGWIANGVRLAWLIDPLREKAWVYRADGSVEVIKAFDAVLHNRIETAH